MLTSKNFYTTGEVADMCNVSPTTIFRAIINNHIKAATTPGGHFRISRTELEAFLRKNNLPSLLAQIETKRILIIENNAMERRSIERILGNIPGSLFKSTGFGYEAGFLTQSFLPNIIILDIFLEDIDGRQMIKLIRADEKLKDTKIVVVTGAKDPADLKEIKALKPDAFFQKPFAPDEFREAVGKLLN
jgi:excisionase family DNA binding protein